MMNFLLLWRGISLGSDALWKLKQRSVTQLSVVYLLVNTEKYTVSGVTFSLRKLEHYVIRGFVSEWFTSYLES